MSVLNDLREIVELESWPIVVHASCRVMSSSDAAAGAGMGIYNRAKRRM